MFFEELDSLYEFNEMNIFKIDINDTYNAAVVKIPVLYCDINMCKLKDIKGIYINEK